MKVLQKDVFLGRGNEKSFAWLISYSIFLKVTTKIERRGIKMLGNIFFIFYKMKRYQQFLLTVKVCLHYAKGLLEKIQKICNLFNIKTTSRSSYTIRRNLCRVKSNRVEDYQELRVLDTLASVVENVTVKQSVPQE